MHSPLLRRPCSVTDPLPRSAADEETQHTPLPAGSDPPRVSRGHRPRERMIACGRGCVGKPANCCEERICYECVGRGRQLGGLRASGTACGDHSPGRTISGGQETCLQALDRFRHLRPSCAGRAQNQRVGSNGIVAMAATTGRARDIGTTGGMARQPLEPIDETQHVRHEYVGDREALGQPLASGQHRFQALEPSLEKPLQKLPLRSPSAVARELQTQGPARRSISSRPCRAAWRARITPAPLQWRARVSRRHAASAQRPKSASSSGLLASFRGRRSCSRSSSKRR